MLVHWLKGGKQARTHCRLALLAAQPRHTQEMLSRSVPTYLASVALLTGAAVTLVGCDSSDGGSGTVTLKFECSDPPLGVAYDIKYYNGAVACGNLLLESDIGGSHPWIQPKVTFPAAEDGLYTLIYLDPYVDLPNNGSWPDVTTPGSKAPARHWVAGNIDATMLKTGDLSGATQVSAYKGPSPPWGSHPYGQFLFKQGAGRMNFTTLPSPAGIYKWDYQSFISQYKLGAPVASNFHMTQHMDPRPTVTIPPKSSVSADILGSLEPKCSDPPLGVAYDIKYYNGAVACGNLLLECDIGGTHPWNQPKVTFPAAEDGLYTLIYLDPYVDLPNNGSWPDVTTPGSKAPARHWVAGNIDATMLKTGDLSGATQVSAYKGPSPPWGSHPYGQFLFKQGAGRMNFTTLPSPAGIYKWDYQSFISQYKLGAPVASNFHMTQHMDPRPTAATRSLLLIRTQAERCRTTTETSQ
ncbi:unnamed protein product [Polarella glacialis]|uniref:Uncharacterized protein n=1 Tax=Polarella glacialis TaxID=89957 RepID=A0A813HMY8_POLGL|nr:unnamed protein product [Polarella glacialis]